MPLPLIVPIGAALVTFGSAFLIGQKNRQDLQATARPSWLDPFVETEEERALKQQLNKEGELTITNLPKYPPPPSYGSETDAWKAWTPVTLQATEASVIAAYKKEYQPVIARRETSPTYETIDPMLLAMGLAGGVALLMIATR